MSFFKSSTLPLKTLKWLIGSPRGCVNRVVQDDENDEGPKLFRCLQVKLCVKVLSVYISNQCMMLQRPLSASDLASGQLVDCGWGIGLGLSTGTSLAAASGRPTMECISDDISPVIIPSDDSTLIVLYHSQSCQRVGQCQIMCMNFWTALRQGMRIMGEREGTESSGGWRRGRSLADAVIS